VQGRVLIVAGSDSGGGAGIQADIKATSALGAYAATAITALTAQNTTGVQAVMLVPPDFIQSQMRSVISDIGADCVKTGMLHDAPVIEAVCDVLESDIPSVPVVVDPVMVAKGGDALLVAGAVATLKARMVPCAAILTPNVPEAEALTGLTIATLDDMRRAAASLIEAGADAALIKGGHLDGPVVRDLLMTGAGEEQVFENRRIDTRHTHGTGCTLASAIAAGIAQGMTPLAAIGRAEAYLHEAIRTAPGFGAGHGPVGHMHTVRPFGDG
jgi:hydroxymethylpyrimidine/phosphomethylpyrimidine kinase